MHVRGCDKLSIRRIECQFKRLVCWKLHKLSFLRIRCCDRNLRDMSVIATDGHQPFKKKVARSWWIAGWTEFILILPQNQPLLIQDNALTFFDRFKALRTFRTASCRHLVSFAVSDQQDVRIDHYGAHSVAVFGLKVGVACACSRAAAACVIAVRSPMLSPKKFSGQLMMLPSRSIWSVSRLESVPVVWAK